MRVIQSLEPAGVTCYLPTIWLAVGGGGFAVGVMDRNPYAPPQAQVADGGLLGTVPERPREVATAVKLLWVSLLLGLLVTALDWQYQSARLPLAILIPSQVLGVVIGVWLIRALGRGRNWARILYLVSMVLTLLSLTAAVWSAPLRAQYLNAYTHSAMVGSLRAIHSLLHMVALGFLFTAPARDWFGQGKR